MSFKVGSVAFDIELTEWKELSSVFFAFSAVDIMFGLKVYFCYNV